MLIRKLATDQYQLFTGDSVVEGSLQELHPLQAGAALTLVLPAALCSLRQVTFEKHERKLLNKLVPFSLEDDLADRVESLHFSIARLPDSTSAAVNSAIVCYLDKMIISAELQAFSASEINLQQCIPEILLLPWQSGQWTLVFPGDGRCLIRNNEGEGLACSLDNLPLTLKVLSGEKPLPLQIRVFMSSSGHSPEARDLLNILPWFDEDKVEFIRQDYQHVLEQGAIADKEKYKSGTLLNLLCGEFAPRLPWGQWAQQWKIAALLLIAIGIVDLGSRGIEINRLASLSQQLNDETEAYFRQVVPEGALVDPRLQLQRRLETLRGNSNSGFIALLDQAAPVIMNNAELEVQNINYSERDREIQLTLITSDFNTAESVRARLQALGLQAEFIGSTSSADGNRSRLRIGS